MLKATGKLRKFYVTNLHVYRAYFSRIFFQEFVRIPLRMRKRILELAQETNFGVTKTKPLLFVDIFSGNGLPSRITTKIMPSLYRKLYNNCPFYTFSF